MRKVKSMLGVTIVLGLLIIQMALGVSSDVGKSQAVLDWQVDYSSEDGSDSYIPSTILTDKKGDVYLSGHQRVLSPVHPYFPIEYYPSLIKLDDDGNQLWKINLKDEDSHMSVIFVDTDEHNNLYVGLTNRLSGRVNIKKYNKTGNLIWEDSFTDEGQAGMSISVKIKIGRKGNVYISQSYLNISRERLSPMDLPGTMVEHVFTKISADGDIEWQAVQDAPSLGKHMTMIGFHPINSFKVDHWGNVVTALSDNGGVRLTKYDADGNVLWEDVFEEEERDFFLFGMAMGKNGAVYLSITEYSNSIPYPGSLDLGFTLRPKGSLVIVTNSFVVKYEADGELGFISDQDLVYQGRLMIDRSDNVYIAGTTELLDFRRSDCEVQKLDADGILQWSHFLTDLQAPIFGSLSSYSVDLDEQNGSLYIISEDYTGPRMLRKINSDGQLCYEQELERPDCLSDRSCAHSSLRVVKDNNKGIYVLGRPFLFSSNGGVTGITLSRFVEENVKGKDR
ncbi:hypothetical protein ACFL3G_07245 [Planctomycetota bacterium]